LKSGKTADAIRELGPGGGGRGHSLHYDEPPTWYYPVRQSLGAALLKSNRPKDAAAVYQDDLRRHPDNGWSLYGLMLAQRAQGLTKDAAATESQFKQAWARADVTLTASAY
jgi:predicted Zn-dependent protease